MIADEPVRDDLERAVPDLLRVLSHCVNGTRLGPDPCAGLQERFRALIGCRHAIPVASGTAALQVALHAVGVGRGDEVVIPVSTCAAVAMATLQLGAVPILAEIDPSLTLDPARLAERLTPRTRAIVAVHQYGLCADIAALRRALPPGAALIEDCAQALGASLDGHPVGRLGDVAVFSFCHGKIVSGGQGGMICCDDAATAAAARRYILLGADEPPMARELGHNFVMPPLSALTVELQMSVLDRITTARSERAAWYRERLSGHGFTPIASLADMAVSTYHRQVCMAPLEGARYDRWMACLRAAGARLQGAHPAPLYRAPWLRQPYRDAGWSLLLDDPAAAFPLSVEVDPRLVYLYVGADMTRQRIDDVCDLMLQHLAATG